ncbi:MAG: tetratricopeptide repeat protein [Alphaproteobacteria bacterium]|nr:tetratricopeptide repeat protein [Alphaproteobacteria bacterium]
MRRLIGFLIKVGVLVALAVWLAETEGPVSIEWQGWRIDTSTTVIGVALIVVIIAAALLYRMWRAGVTAPRRLMRARALRRRERGYHAITLGLVAASAGDAGEAQRQARRATGLLDRQPLTLMLSAQAAQLAGNETAARQHFDAMLEHPDTAFLGLRGLLTASLEAGDHRAALDYAERARSLSPNAPWLLDSLFELHARTGDWAAAAAVAQAAAKRKTVEVGEARRRQALAALGQAETAEAAGQLDEAIRHARAAVAATPGSVPAVVRLARLHLVAGRHAQAAKLIEQAWPAAAHPELVALYGQAMEESDPLLRVKRFERLVKRAPDEAEGQLALGDAALHARLWGEARKHYEAAAERAPATRARAYRGLAEIEELESHDRERALDWRTRAAAAPPTPFWLCTRCDHPASSWSVRCLQCDAVGSLSWHQPVAGTISEILPDGVTDAVVIESAVVDDPEQRRAEQRLAALAHAARGGSAPDDKPA